ncbi:glucose-6-phosphate dehydrogenase [Salisaeta longa]|uniref:glucose-6-phosphate dehydrogenase n=1 Tax=Salisaeta longa TaxID=503170 RepID=UPI0003B33E86|nr:glucose-6-phosphate dehydrogenase [Salisaeta longa]
MAPIDPHLFVIFGATGDLTKRKLLPALYHLMQEAGVAEQCYILGVARSEWSDDDFRAEARDALADEELGHWCDEHLFYQSIGSNSQRYDALRDRVEALEAAHDLPGNRVFYLSLPPAVYGDTVEAIGEVGLNASDGWTRVVIEKPFGHDLASAQQLNERIHRHFSEDEIYRIDHYLGKETVQNLLAFRFGNAIFESLWNRDRIERVEVTVAEPLGVGTRAGYYDDAGHLRDMVQNHLTQLFTLVAMEPPATFGADAIRGEKVKVLRATRAIDKSQVVFGQYDAGTVADEEVPAYRAEDGVPDDSDTETFVALPLYVDNWRWQGVPFYLRTGKRLPEKRTQIAVHFRCAPVSIFETETGGACDVNPNVLVITLQPNEGFDLHFEVKKPGDGMQLATQRLDFRYKDAFGPIPDAYSTLIRDIITGDQTLFVHSDEVEASWRLYTPLLAADLPVHTYPAGSWGPEAVAQLLPRWTNGAVPASEGAAA